MESRWSYHNLRRNTTISHIKESNYIEKSLVDQQEDIREVSEISHDKLPLMPEKYAFMYHNFYPKPKLDLEDAKI